MKTRLSYCFAVLTVLAVLPFAERLGWAQKSTSAPKKKLALSIKPQDVTDALRAVIASDRDVYTRQVTERSPEKGLANPCEMFRLSSEATASKGVEFSYVLRSLRPLRQRNAPETELEKKGLEFVLTHRDQAYYAEEILGGRWYFTAVYPDIAASPSCVTCHNQQPASPKKDYKLGDVMGGVVVRVALEL
jgi:hypothetical protein